MNQGGSVATFIVIGVILAAGLVGTTYFLNQRGEQVRKDQTIAANKEKQGNKKPIKSDESDKPTATNVNVSKTPTSAPGESSKLQDLPVTGPELSASELLGIYLLVAVTAAYLVSRRILARSL